jgi:hypothetical protein
MIKVKSFKKLKGNSKKYEITFEKNGKMYTRKFGATGMSDYTIHKDKERRERYISRHKKDLRTGDPMRPGYLSMYILWNKPSVKASLADYKRRLGVYNKTGKFPKDIAGSKKLSFGMKNAAEIKDLLANKVRWDPAQMILEYAAAPELQKLARGYLARTFTKSKRYLKMVLLAINIDYYKRRRVANPEQRAMQEMEADIGSPWEALDPRRYETAFFMRQCSRILKRSDRADLLWYNCMFTVLEKIAQFDPEYKRYPENISANLNNCIDSVINLLPVLTDPQVWPDLDNPRWYRRAIIEIEENEEDEEDEEENQFGKKYKVPGNVVNKKLYSNVKAKIKRSIKGRRWGAYDSGRLVREYKAAGGKYSGPKGKTNLSRWYKEKWVDACAWPKIKPCGRKTKQSIAYCRPSKKVDSKTPKLVQKLTAAQRKSRCARKKKSPMKRITKFGRTEPDESVAWGDGSWVIHCNYYPWGAHSTIRYKPLAERPGDYSYHYGIYNNGTLRLWATGGAINTPIPPGLRSILINHYNTRCKGNMSFGQNQELLDKMRQQMFKQLMSAPDVNTGIQSTIIKRCKRGFSDPFCQDIFTQILLSIYFTIISKSKMTPNRRTNLTEMQSFIPTKFKPTVLNITKNDFSKIDEMLYLLQDHTYGNFKNARVASLIYEYIHQK